MRRRLTPVLVGTVIALFGGVAGATAAAAADDGPSPHSNHGQCVSAAAGQHLGWAKQGNGERRNLGGTCPAQEP